MAKKINPQNLKKVIYILLGLVIITTGVGYFYYQKNIFGEDQVRFEIAAPESVEMGEKVDYVLRYSNNSDVRLEDVMLIFEYPEKSMPTEEEEEEEIRKRGEDRREIEVGELNPGQEKTTTFSARLFGKQGDDFTASASIRYVPKNLAARYESKREHLAVLESVPINFSFQIPSTVDPEREMSARLKFSSEVDYPLTDLEVRVRYPGGFRFIRGTPQTDAEDKNKWDWPVLNKGDDATIDIDGVLEGSPGDARIFNATLGMWKGDKFIPLKETSKGTAISRSSLILEGNINGREDYVADSGELLHYEIFFRNIGEETLEDLFLLVDLDESTLNLDQVEPMDGRFQEDRGVIIWSHTFDFALQSLKQDEDGRVEFWARVKEDLPHDPEIKVKASMERAEKIVETKVNTRLSIDQNVVTEESPFEVSGPFPFEKGEESSYTVRWNIKNFFSGVRDVSVKATLPEGARITGEKSPEDIGDLSFNSSNREVELNIEGLHSGEEREIFFEVEIEPEKDFEEEDLIISEAQISAEDRRTENTVRSSAAAVFLDEILGETGNEE